MSKNEMNNMESMTMPQAKAALDELVKKYNDTVDVTERTKLEIEGKDLATKYNALSLLTAYAGIMAEPNPVVAIAKAVARLQGRDFVTPRDVQNAFFQTIPHRLQLSAKASGSKKSVQQVLKGILAAVPAPELK